MQTNYMVQWDTINSTESCLCNTFAASQVYAAISRIGYDRVMVFDITTGIRVNPDIGMLPYSDENWHNGRYILGGWKVLAEKEQVLELANKENAQKEKDRSSNMTYEENGRYYFK